MILSSKNKRGQFESVLIVVISMFIIGMVLFFMNHFDKQIYDKYDEYLGNNTDLSGTEAHVAIRDIRDLEETNIWDYAFLAIFVGLMIQLLLFSFATRINIAFYWLFAILGIIILIVGVMLTATWQELSINPEFGTTLARFPITNTLLGTYFTWVISFIVMISMIILFGKRPSEIT